MTDVGILRKIVTVSRIKKDETVLEIGAGKGFLTRELARNAGNVIAIEIDRKLKNELIKNLSGADNVEVVFGNALKIMKRMKFNRIVSNIPYAISESLLQELVFIEFDSAILTLPEPFAMRLLAEPGDRRFSRLSIIAMEFFNIKILFEVPMEAFHPNPKTRSVTVMLKKKNEQSLFCMVFLKRKMKLKNAIMRVLFEHENCTKNQARKQIKSLNINSLLDKKMTEMDTGKLKTVWNRLQEIQQTTGKPL
jgi:16S rRNA (adenine1518-N6/adenine1519-N6)-dimethyltransferase